MKANELMIGDLVNLKNGKVIMPCRITVIGHATQDRNEIGTTVCVDLSKEFPTCIFDMDVITPIPLTPEALKKNGWEYNNYNDETEYEEEYYVDENGFDIHINGEKFEVRCIDAVNIQLKYLHELQHVLKLCGIEKTIEL